MVTRSAFGALAAARGIKLRADPGAIVTDGAALAACIDLAEAEGLVILGLEGFELDGEAVVPLLDYNADFSGIKGGSRRSRVKRSAASAHQVIREWGPMPDLVEVTLEGLDEIAGGGPAGAHD